MTEISSIHTPCKKCVFAEYESITQTGCALGYIDIFKSKEYPILEVYDNENEFYVINDKKCIGYRENKWFDEFGLSDATLEEKINKYNELNHINYTIVLNLKDLNYDEFETICDTIKSCEFQPKKIIIIRYANDDQIFSYSRIESTFKIKNILCRWRIQTMLDSELSYNDVINNIVCHNIETRFVVSVSKSNVDLLKIINTANDIVYKNFDQFVVMGNEDKTCFIFSTAVFKYGKMLGKFILLEDSEYTTI